MATETELKLELEPEAAAFLEASDLLMGPRTVAKQHALYFDTPGHRLLSEGISLRIRRVGRKRTQTIKVANGPASGLFTRSEIERSVRNDEPVIEADSPLIPLLGDKADALQPLFAVTVERHSWLLHEGASQIELVIDSGRAHVGEREAPISEVELELKAGDTSDLFSIARKLDRIVPLRLGMQSKSERGYALLGPAINARKAEPIALDLTMRACDAFRQIALACLRQYRLNEALLLQTWHPDALHQARVALRRLRSAFTIFKPMLVGDARARLFESALRDVSAVLGNARNLDVLREKRGTGSTEPAIEEARDTAYADVRVRLASIDVRTLMLDLLEWLDRGAWLAHAETADLRDQNARDFAAKALGKLRKKIRKHGHILRSGSDADRHRVRKDAKKLRYASEFFASLFHTAHQERRHGTFIKTLEKLQARLGTLNDVATADALLTALGLVEQGGSASVPDRRHRKRLIKRADAQWADLVALKPFWR